MPKLYVPLVNWVKRQPILEKAARRALPMIPDLPITLNLPHMGRIRFGLRRHRWMLGSNCLGGHGHTLGTFKRLVHEGDVFYDIGANIGYYVRFILNNLPVSHIVAFEPMAANIRLLRQNIELSGRAGDVTLMPIALGDAASKEQLQVDDMTDGSAVLSRISHGEASAGRRELGLPPTTEIVQVRPLDQVIEQEKLPPPNVMKIDVEGAEIIVLRGSLKTLQTHRPRLAIATHGPDKAVGVVELIERLGYHCYGLVGPRNQGVYQRLTVENAANLADNNIVASMEQGEVAEAIVPLW